MKKLILSALLFASGCGWACFETGPGCYQATDAVYNLSEASRAPLPWAAQGPYDCWVYVPCGPVVVRQGSCASWAYTFPSRTVPCTLVNPNMIQCQAPIF